MKKVLLASVALAATASVAAADVKLSGYGRFGVVYNSESTDDSDVLFAGRLRFNIDASTESAGGVKFGGRVRIQWDQGNNTGFADGEAERATGPGAQMNAAMMYVSYGGLRVEVGNANTAYDSAALMYDSEMGFQDSGFGDPAGGFFAYNSRRYSTADVNRVGLFASYTMGDFTGRISYVDVDQTTDATATTEAETGISADYTFGDFTVSAAAVWNAGAVEDRDMYFVGAAYNLAAMDATIGLLYFDNDDSSTGNGETITLYGNKKFGDITAKAYIANNNADGNDTDTAFGIGADYDLGNKTKISGSVQRGYGAGGGDAETVADIGVRFDF